MQRSILVAGATGNTGRHVVAGLLAEDHRVRALTRHPSGAGLPQEVEVITGDTTRAEDVAAAARGTSAAYLIWPGTDDDAAGAADVIGALSRQVDRVVYLSAAVAETGVWGRVEDAVRASGMEWTFLRVTGLATNTLGWADQTHLHRVRAPFGGIRRSLVHEQDVAALAVRALVDDGHAGQSYLVTGPEVLSQAEQVRIIGEEIGQEVTWDEQPLDEAREELTNDVGAEFADKILTHWQANAQIPEPVSQDVAGVIGRQATTFRQWVRDHRAEFTAQE